MKYTIIEKNGTKQNVKCHLIKNSHPKAEMSCSHKVKANFIIVKSSTCNLYM